MEEFGRGKYDQYAIYIEHAKSILHDFCICFSTGIAYKNSYLMAGAQRRRKTSSTGDDLPNSQPAKWPGERVL